MNKNNRKFFVMMLSNKKECLPLMAGEGEVAWFESAEDAAAVARENFEGKALGWEVFALGGGVDQG